MADKPVVKGAAPGRSGLCSNGNGTQQFFLAVVGTSGKSLDPAPDLSLLSVPEAPSVRIEWNETCELPPCRVSSSSFFSSLHDQLAGSPSSLSSPDLQRSTWSRLNFPSCLLHEYLLPTPPPHPRTKQEGRDGV